MYKIKQPKPFDTGILEEVKKRLGFTDKEFSAVMKKPRKTFLDYRTYKPVFERLKWLFWLMCRANLVPTSFYIKYTRKHTDAELETIRSIGRVPLPFHVKTNQTPAATIPEREQVAG